MKNVSKILAITIAGIFLLSCSGENKKEQTEEFPTEIQEFVEETFDYPIPTAGEVTKMLQKANASFVYDITNDPENVTNYITEWQMAMNLGIYGADLSYASTYKRQEEVLQFLEASKTLVDQLNISTAFNAKMLARMERNIEDQDSLILIVTESLWETYNYLNKNGEEKTSLLVIAGSVIEGLHITSQLIISSEYDESLMEVLAFQKERIKKLVELMDAHADDENVNKVLPTLRYIDLFFDQVGEDAVITQGQFEDIYGSIKDVRSRIVD